ncbi:MAG: inositol monophosphatase [Planctomycetota bacterium]
MSLPAIETLVARTLELHDAIRETCRERSGDVDGSARPHGFEGGDTIYQLDMHVEPLVLDWAESLAKAFPLVLVVEGIAGGRRVFPRGTEVKDAAFWVIVDPIDGTRGLMVDKRSAWSLTAFAPQRGEATSLDDLELAVQSELPTAKQAGYDVLWARRGGPVTAERRWLDSEHRERLDLQPSRAEGLDHGFAMVASFFPGIKREAAELVEFLVAKTTKGASGFVPVFDDQYISTGGQLYELIAGHDRFNADLRPLFYRLQGETIGLSCHAYDICTALIAEAAGVLIADGLGRPLRGPLDVTTPVHWAGFANSRLHGLLQPLILKWFRDRGLRAEALD